MTLPAQPPHRRDEAAAADRTPPISTPCLIDDEFDDFLDRHLAAIRESLADFRNL